MPSDGPGCHARCAGEVHQAAGTAATAARLWRPARKTNGLRVSGAGERGGEERQLNLKVMLNNTIILSRIFFPIVQ